MSSNIEPYISHNPGDLWTAEDWNDVQKKIKQDIGDQIKVAVENKKTIEHADNADKLENQSLDELTQAILEKVRQDLPKRTGYRSYFKRLTPNVEKIIEHNLGSFPLVDIYGLRPFTSVCSEDDLTIKNPKTFFYLYQDEEKTVRVKPEGGGASESVKIERLDGPNFHIAFGDLLTLYEVKYDNNTSLDDLESDFWDKFLADEFGDDDYCISPWFMRCCGERRTVGQLKATGEWDNLLLKVQPEKSVNIQVETFPATLRVFHYDFNKLGILYTPAVNTPGATEDQRVMVLLKV
ncbi:MAG TPA: hypothetical protein VIW80_13250 [Pyrinomonadaceae bacterium]|jgi:hypothetical protein